VNAGPEHDVARVAGGAEKLLEEPVVRGVVLQSAELEAGYLTAYVLA